MTPLATLVLAIRLQADREQALLKFKSGLANSIAKMHTEGRVAGKNSEERDATVRVSTENVQALVDETAGQVIQARAETEVARLYYDASLRTEVQP